MIWQRERTSINAAHLSSQRVHLTCLPHPTCSSFLTSLPLFLSTCCKSISHPMELQHPHVAHEPLWSVSSWRLPQCPGYFPHHSLKDSGIQNSSVAFKQEVGGHLRFSLHSYTFFHSPCISQGGSLHSPCCHKYCWKPCNQKGIQTTHLC